MIHQVPVTPKVPPPPQRVGLSTPFLFSTPRSPRSHLFSRHPHPYVPQPVEAHQLATPPERQGQHRRLVSFQYLRHLLRRDVPHDHAPVPSRPNRHPRPVRTQRHRGPRPAL